MQRLTLELGRAKEFLEDTALVLSQGGYHTSLIPCVIQLILLCGPYLTLYCSGNTFDTTYHLYTIPPVIPHPNLLLGVMLRGLYIMAFANVLGT